MSKIASCPNDWNRCFAPMAPSCPLSPVEEEVVPQRPKLRRLPAYSSQSGSASSNASGSSASTPAAWTATPASTPAAEEKDKDLASALSPPGADKDAYSAVGDSDISAMPSLGYNAMSRSDSESSSSSAASSSASSPDKSASAFMEVVSVQCFKYRRASDTHPDMLPALNTEKSARSVRRNPRGLAA